MYTKLEISGKIRVITGLHIGGSSAFAAIGAVDSPVVRDTLSGLPMIPGSSLKGKMRTLLSRSSGKMTRTPDDDIYEICRLFGSKNERSRVLFTDSVILNQTELKGMGVSSVTEVKFENSINRGSGQANPRQLERVIRGAEFSFSLIYEVVDENELYEDLSMIAQGIQLLELDYLGGSGSRGYGKITFENIELLTILGCVDEAILGECEKLF